MRQGVGAEAPTIHATAVLGVEVQLGRRTLIGPHAVLEDGVILGDDCTVLANVTIYSGTTIGDRGFSARRSSGSGFGYARNAGTGAYLAFPQQGTLIIEDDVDIGANTTIDRGALGETRIGSGTDRQPCPHRTQLCAWEECDHRGADGSVRLVNHCGRRDPGRPGGPW